MISHDLVRCDQLGQKCVPKPYLSQHLRRSFAQLKSIISMSSFSGRNRTVFWARHVHLFLRRSGAQPPQPPQPEITFGIHQLGGPIDFFLQRNHLFLVVSSSGICHTCHTTGLKKENTLRRTKANLLTQFLGSRVDTSDVPTAQRIRERRRAEYETRHLQMPVSSSGRMHVGLHLTQGSPCVKWSCARLSFTFPNRCQRTKTAG